MSSNQWVNQAIGVVAGVVVGFFTAGTASFATYAAIAGLTTYAVTTSVANYIGGANRPKISGGMARPTPLSKPTRNTVQDAASGSLAVNSASEAVLIPVPFGRVMLSGNYLRYDNNTFRTQQILERIPRDTGTVAYEQAKKIYQSDPRKVDKEIDAAWKKASKSQSSGGKGGGSSNSSPPPSQAYNESEKITAYVQLLLEKDASGKSSLPKEYDEFVKGYKYFFTFELGVCMGPIDRFYSLRAQPGDFLATVTANGPAADLVAPLTNFTASSGEQGGVWGLYRGDADQVRNVADPYNNIFGNYRGVCFALFNDFYIGQTPTPLSYQFDIGRYPKCLDADGVPVVGMEVHGSTDPNSIPYMDANPAAILYELFTNKVWGKGMSPDLLDIPSFVSASQYFAAEEIGMSFTVTTPTIITDVVEQIRQHVSTVVVWAGGKLYCRCLMDLSTAYEPMITLSPDSISDFTVTRPAWPSCINELRATYVDIYANYVDSVVIAQDLAGIATQGAINSSVINLPCFSRRDVTDKMTKRMLMEASYPQAVYSFKMNRFETRLIPGDFVRLRWSEWSAGPVTLYMRITEITDRDQDKAGIMVRAVEDLYATSTEGAPDVFVPPVPAFEGLVSVENEDVMLGDDPNAAYTDAGLNLTVTEMPISLTDSDRLLTFFSQRSDHRTVGLMIYWRQGGSGHDWQFIGEISPWALTGKLVGDLFAGTTTTRNADFEIELDQPFELGRFLEWCSRAPTPEDHLDVVTGSETNILRLGDELIFVAQAEEGSAPNRVLIKGIVRGQYGTDAAFHADETPCALVYQFIPYAYTLRYDNVDPNFPLEIRGVPVDRRGVEGEEIIIETTITGKARKPMAIQVWTAGVVGGVWTVSFRPRFHNRGQDFCSDFESMLNTLTVEIPEGYEFFLQAFDASDNLLTPDPVKIAVTFTADDGNSPATGMANFFYTAPVGTTYLQFYSAFQGVPGYPARIEP